MLRVRDCLVVAPSAGVDPALVALPIRARPPKRKLARSRSLPWGLSGPHLIVLPISKLPGEDERG